MAEQLAFDLPVRTSLARGDFFVSSANSLAVTRLDDVASWPLGKLMVIAPKGAGKTHLTHLWSEAQNARVLTPKTLSEIEIGSIKVPIALDDCDEVDGDKETFLFHLHNHLAAEGLPFLLTAKSNPQNWSTELADLRSRMEASDVVRIAEPDDLLLSAVLVKLFTDRQIAVDPGLISWLIPRMDRSFAGAQSVVTALDQTALAKKCRVNRGLAATVLDKLDTDRP